VVSLLYRAGTVRLDEFDGRVDLVFFKTQPDPDAQWVELGGATGMWFSRPHAVEYVDRAGNTHHETSRLAGPTLIWTDGSVTYRLEGIAARDEALAVAVSID
jgi:hypothetical protein